MLRPIALCAVQVARKGCCSPPAIAWKFMELAKRIVGQLSDCKVLVLGAGETSERTARALVSRGVNDLRVSNRSIDRAHELARMVGGRVIPFDEWPAQCREIDILVTSTSSE